jgi:hypothetical protein
MNPILKSLDEVKFRIPSAILREAFSSAMHRWKDTPVSIDEQITNLVIKNRVLVDCNLVGGTEVLIPLDNLEVKRVDTYTSIYNIPKALTQGRTIMSVLSVGYASTSLQGMAGGLGGVRPNSVTPTTMAGMAMMDAMSPMPIASSAKVQLIAENTIMVRDISPLTQSGYLRCVLANDDNLNHIQMRSIPAFCRLVELATKSYVYNELIIKIGSAQLSGGQDLGVFKEKIEGYSDSEELYQEHLNTVWAKVAYMNDRETFNRYLKMQVGAMR